MSVTYRAWRKAARCLARDQFLDVLRGKRMHLQVPECRCDGFRQNSGLGPEFGQEREEKQPRFESETKCHEDRLRRLLGPEL